MKTPRPAHEQQLEDSVEAAQQFWQTLDDRVLGHLAVMQTELARSVAGVALQGAEVRPILTGQSKRIATSGGRCVGWSFRETAGAVATLYLRDGRDNTGDIVAVIQLAANESTRDSYMPSGLSYLQGLYVDQTAGSVEGAVYIGAVD